MARVKTPKIPKMHISSGGGTRTYASKSGKLVGGGFRTGSVVKPTKWTKRK
ncbi:hypothetical protein [Deinococcus soli (ex Cha et al. 2016)]|uniref:Uncharacterized protein n=2 Tax=Deinococcus soli (ex Cha et al. 2016) TaxID=1309411 RepID=A0ACC6KFA5_9DEIO|nr:hypothetical protein [Deinococcus soli (ex Cha et al. 2016)]MDR6218235.1 hypothetical protein [Deinococcus soli (ex Cha et al. 2016)]MDR6328975.1 hypothetical protein [Deinococcus soli (ex Cha et al. 2016)]MDR6751248.1 hypothetical protein [Deinococcus soli (ex Cha et al. 2016)]